MSDAIDLEVGAGTWGLGGDLPVRRLGYGHSDRSSEAILDRCETEALAFLPWAPLGGGRLVDPMVERFAAAHDATDRQVALAWLLARSPVMLPIPGTGSVAHLEENAAARELRLTPQEIGELNRL